MPPSEAGLGSQDVHASVHGIQAPATEVDQATSQVQLSSGGVSADKRGDGRSSALISEQTNRWPSRRHQRRPPPASRAVASPSVADEVRQPAGRTRHSTGEIRSTITQLQQAGHRRQRHGRQSQAGGEQRQPVRRRGRISPSSSITSQHVSDIGARSPQRKQQDMVAEDANRNVSGINDSALEMSPAASPGLAAGGELLAGLPKPRRATGGVQAGQRPKPRTDDTTDPGVLFPSRHAAPPLGICAPARLTGLLSRSWPREPLPGNPLARTSAQIDRNICR